MDTGDAANSATLEYPLMRPTFVSLFTTGYRCLERTFYTQGTCNRESQAGIMGEGGSTLSHDLHLDVFLLFPVVPFDSTKVRPRSVVLYYSFSLLGRHKGIPCQIP
jgi:hypothetical protein